MVNSPFCANLDRIRAACFPSEQLRMDALLITSGPNRFFATGFPSSAGMALITPTHAYFMTDFRYIEAAQKKIAGFEIMMVTAQKGYNAHIAELVRTHAITSVGFEESVMSWASHKALSDVIGIPLVPAGDLLTTLRAVKLPFEIERLITIQRIAEKSLEELIPHIQPGVREREVAARLTYLLMQNGAEGNSFDPIVVSGENGAMPHGVPGERMLQNGDFVTIDFGGILNGYCSDMTRTFAIGHATADMRRVYGTVLAAQEAALLTARAHMSGRALDAVARDIIAAAGYGDCFGHGLGHGLGIEVHDTPGASPSNDKPLPEGMALTIEPGIYLPGQFGIRIEDVVILRADGADNITRSPKELMIL